MENEYNKAIAELGKRLKDSRDLKLIRLVTFYVNGYLEGIEKQRRQKSK